MKTSWRVWLWLLIGLAAAVQTAAADGSQTMEFAVDGVVRSALVYVPPGAAGGKNLPLVFAFHGHGGSSRNALNTFKLDRLWPEAISIYPQGLDTPGMVSDPEGKRSGWQNAIGGQADRDLHFFDAMLARLKKDYPVDPARVYCTGHSNGAGFTYLLWRARADGFAAFAPCSGAARYVKELTPKPAMILGGDADPIVKTEWQQLMMLAVRKVNACDDIGEPWEGAGTIYPSKGGTPLVTYVYPGGHMMIPAEAPLIVKFFNSIPFRRLRTNLGATSSRESVDGAAPFLQGPSVAC